MKLNFEKLFMEIKDVSFKLETELPSFLSLDSEDASPVFDLARHGKIDKESETFALESGHRFNLVV